MELTHQFTVPAPIDVAWDAFNDLERIAPCFPGAALTSYDGDTFEGLCKVKLGPISLQYTGTGRFLERDETSHKAVIEAKGKDKRGNGTAAALVTATLQASGADATDVIVQTDLNITGKPAQFGRGVMQDVSDKLLGQFATCLETKLDTSQDAPTAAAVAEDRPADSTGVAEDTPIAAEAAAAVMSATPPAATSFTEAAQPRAAAATPPRRTPTEPPAAELDLGATVLPVLLKRYAAQIVGAVVVLWIIRKIFSRG